jgi:integrase/recombinase XerC
MGDEWNEAVETWLADAARSSGCTLRAYQQGLKDFKNFINPTLLRNVGGSDVANWVSALTRRGLAPATVNARLAAVSAFYRFVMNVYTDADGKPLAHYNPAAAVKRARVEMYGKSKPLTEQQVRQLLSVIDVSTVRGARDYAVLLMAIYTGRRSAELRNLRWGDIEMTTDGQCARYHWQGKGGTSRWDDLPPPVCRAICNYLERAGRRPELDEPVFVRHNGQGGLRPLTSEFLNSMVKRYARLAGLSEDVHAHTLRHTAANLRYKLTDLRTVSQLLGHASFRITEVYLARLVGFKDDSWAEVERLLDGGDSIDKQ